MGLHACLKKCNQISINKKKKSIFLFAMSNIFHLMFNNSVPKSKFPSASLLVDSKKVTQSV